MRHPRLTTSRSLKMEEKPTLTTKAELAREAGIDSRNPVLEALEPCADLTVRI
jgi:hypothetical protein